MPEPSAEQGDVEAAARGLRAAREFLNRLPLTDGASQRAIDREFITIKLIPEGLMALDRLAAALEKALRERDDYRENANTGAAVSRRFVDRAERAEATRRGMDKAFSVEQKVAAELEARAEKAERALGEMDDAIRDALDFLPAPGGPRNDPVKAAQILVAALCPSEEASDE